MFEHRRYTLGEILFGSIVSGGGFFLSIAGLVLFLLKAHNVLTVVFGTLFMTFLILYFLFLCLDYSFHNSVRNLFLCLERNSILLLLMGMVSFVGICYIRGVIGWVLFGISIFLMTIGVVFNSISVRRFVVIWLVMSFILSFGLLSSLFGIFFYRNLNAFFFLIPSVILSALGVIFSFFSKRYFRSISSLFFLLSIIFFYLFTYFFVI